MKNRYIPKVSGKNVSGKVAGAMMLAGAAAGTMVISMISPDAKAQQDFSKVEIKTSELSDGVYMLTGAGGNIGVSVGEDGVFIIDDQFAPLSEKIMTALGELSDKPVSYVLNTHWHGDHTGGNENFGASGAVIVAHENVRKRMSTKQFMAAFGREVPASPEAALPVVTFSENANFYFNDVNINVMHQPAAHTDGDSFVMFTEANVLHMGDTFFNGFFPFIDHSSGGSLNGLMTAVEAAIGMVDDKTIIIPGHGPVAGKEQLQSYHAMLQEVLSLMQPLVASGMTREEAVNADPLAEIGKTWGNGFMKTKVFTGIVFDTLADS